MSAFLGFGASALNYYGAREANKSNERLARNQMDFQRSSAREQMAFQERMSNTAYQRSVEDMRKAGINPILAFNQGGASTPSGASSSGASARVDNELAGAVSSALQFRAVKAQVEQARATTDLMRAELPEKQANASFYSSAIGKYYKVLENVLSPLTRLFSFKRISH